ncbi:RVT_1 domain-containing protein, partial [Cephalotus follicularis]
FDHSFTQTLYQGT